MTDGGAETIALSRPFTALVSILGVAPILMHGWNCEAVEEKAKAAKGSKGKKTDDLESYVYRDKDGFLGIPGTYLQAAICSAAKFYQDPRSPRKSMHDLCRAAIIPLTTVALFQPKTKEWDYEDRRRVTIQRNAITRVRPAMREGWRLTFEMLVTLPEYVSTELLSKIVSDAGRLSGIGDFRPTYGRFSLVGLEVKDGE